MNGRRRSQQLVRQVLPRELQLYYARLTLVYRLLRRREGATGSFGCDHRTSRQSNTLCRAICKLSTGRFPLANAPLPTTITAPHSLFHPPTSPPTHLTNLPIRRFTTHPSFTTRVMTPLLREPVSTGKSRGTREPPYRVPWVLGRTQFERGSSRDQGMNDCPPGRVGCWDTAISQNHGGMSRFPPPGRTSCLGTA